MTENQKRDHALYYLETPDPGFSPEHNKAVVDASIRKHYKMRIQKLKASRENNAERIDAMVSYIWHLKKGKIANFEKYFGKAYTSYLRGDAIKEEYMARLSVLRGDKIVKFTK